MSHDHGQYGLPDIRQLMTGRPPPQFGGLPVLSGQAQVVESFPVLHHPGLLPLTTPHHYESLGSSGGGVLSSSTVDFDFGRQESTVMNAARGGGGVACGLELEGGFGIGGEAAGNGRWPRQETLTLLEIRSRLDFKFKEANQKGPLWDEVSRIMGEENGYHRSGKKCREKFENLYKYYKKTKEGKAGRQDGKHYRFFRQLEAIYGGSNNNNNLNNQPPSSLQETNLGSYNNNINNMPLLGHDMIKNQETGHHHHHFQEHGKNNMISESLSFTNEYSSTELETSSSENVNANNNDDNQDLSAIAFMMSGQNNKSNKEKRVVGRSGGNWKAKVKEFIDSNMRKLMETQEEWMERMLKAIEVKETERMREEEERRRQEAARLEREQEYWAKERAWLEARDVALMEALKKVSGDSTNLGVFCNIMEERSKKLKEDTRTYNYFQQLDLYNSNSQDHHHQQQQQGQEQGNGGINMDSNSNVGILHMNNEEMWWDKFGLKLSNDKYHQG